MKKLLFLFSSILLFTSCEKETINNEPDEIVAIALKGKPDKISICHYNPHNDTYKTISVNENQLARHLEHGDKRAPCGYTYVPDDTFEQDLIDLGLDDVLDDYVSTANISSLKELRIFGAETDPQNIDLTGLEDFTSLITLEIHHYQMFSLDISRNTRLTKLILTGGLHPTLDIINHPSIEWITINEGSISNVTITGNPNLLYVFGRFGFISNMIISRNPSLINFGTFDVSFDSLTITDNDNLRLFDTEGFTGVKNLDFSTNPNMEEIKVLFGSDLESLNTSSLTKLKTIIIGGGPSVYLSSLDVSDNIQLEILEVAGNSLNSLDVSNNPNLLVLSVPMTINFNCIKVSQEQFDNIPIGWSKDPEDFYSLTCE